VPHSKGFLAHSSDGDVALHALVDALPRALATAISVRISRQAIQMKALVRPLFWKYAVSESRARGRIANLEVTLICERPKIGPMRDTMRAKSRDIRHRHFAHRVKRRQRTARLTGRERVLPRPERTIRCPGRMT